MQTNLGQKKQAILDALTPVFHGSGGVAQALEKRFSKAPRELLYIEPGKTMTLGGITFTVRDTEVEIDWFRVIFTDGSETVFNANTLEWFEW